MIDSEVIFREVQYMRRGQRPLMWFMTITTLITIFGVGSGIATDIRNAPESSAVVPLVIIGAFVAIFIFGILGLFYVMNLATEVHRDGLYYRYYPIDRKFRKIPLDNVVKVEARTYDPLGEYLGWGVKGNRSHRAFSISGNLGVRIDYADGRSILIGSQHPGELARAIEVIRQS